MHQIIKKNVTVLLKSAHAARQCINKGSFDNEKFQTIGFHSSSCLNQLTSSNNRYVPLCRGNQVCAEAKTNCLSLVSLDLNTIEQLFE